MLEASDGVGGRARTDVVDGFLLDRGFQVLLTAYPQVAAQLDVDALELGRFEPGAVVWDGSRLVRVTDPRRRPGSVLSTLRARVASPVDAVKLLRLLRDVRRPADPYALLGTANGSGQPGSAPRPERTTADALHGPHGFSDRLWTRFLRPFLAGILLDERVEASDHMSRFVLRMFADGDAALPAAGMGAMAQRLADRLPAGTVRLGARVGSVDADGVVLTDGERVAARAVVVAAGPWASAQLLGEQWGEHEAMGCVTVYFDAPRSPAPGRMLVLNGVGGADGPVNEVSVSSDVAPTYAPAGRSLVGATCLGVPTAPDAELEPAVRRQLRTWFGPQVDEWRHLRSVRVEQGLPNQRPPWLTRRDWPVEVSPGRFVVGDHRDTASIDGALRSGARGGELAATHARSVLQPA